MGEATTSVIPTFECECGERFGLDSGEAIFDKLVKHVKEVHREDVGVFCLNRGLSKKKYQIFNKRSLAQHRSKSESHACKAGYCDLELRVKGKRYGKVLRRSDYVSPAPSEAESDFNDDSDDEILRASKLVKFKKQVDDFLATMHQSDIVADKRLTTGRQLMNDMLKELATGLGAIYSEGMNHITIDQLEKNSTFKEHIDAKIAEFGLPKIPFKIATSTINKNTGLPVDIHVVDVIQILRDLARNCDYFNNSIKHFLKWRKKGLKKGGMFEQPAEGFRISCNMCGELYQKHPFFRDKRFLPFIIYVDGVRMSKCLETSGPAQSVIAIYVVIDREDTEDGQCVGDVKWALSNIWPVALIPKNVWNEDVMDRVFKTIADMFNGSTITLKDGATEIMPRVCVLTGDHPEQCEIQGVKNHAAARVCMRCDKIFETKRGEVHKDRRFEQLSQPISPRTRIDKRKFDERVELVENCKSELKRQRTSKTSLADVQKFTGINVRTPLNYF